LKCPACQSIDFILYGEVVKFKLPFFLYKCKKCGSFFQDRKICKEDEWYNEDYYSGKADYSYIDERNIFRASMQVWKARIKNIRKFQKDGLYLDVGCSFGGLVQAASRYFDAYGMDISEYAVTEGNKSAQKNHCSNHFKGLYFTKLTDADASVFLKNSFSVISMIEVIEHLFSPEKDIRAAYDLLKPGGILVIQTANLASWQAINAGIDYHYFLPGHLTCFTAAGLKILIENNGFRVLREYIPVDFGLWPKIIKQAMSISGFRLFGILTKTSFYHWKSYLKRKGIPVTASYVLYCIRQ